jgi:SPX domain protein involved in polyphosphate accumulation
MTSLEHVHNALDTADWQRPDITSATYPLKSLVFG